MYFIHLDRQYVSHSGGESLSKIATHQHGLGSEDDFLELTDWLEAVRRSLDLNLAVSDETKSDLQDGLAHAEAALRRALAEVKLRS